MKTKNDLAATIVAMSYGELRAVAEDFSNMIDKEVRPKIETREEFCDLLFDWAETLCDEIGSAGERT